MPAQPRPLSRRCRRLLLCCLSFAVAVGAAACDESTVEVERVSRIEISGASLDAVLIGDTLRFEATVRGEDGGVLQSREITWRVRDTSVARMVEPGVFLATGAGTTVVTAISEGVAGDAPVVVEADPGRVRYWVVERKGSDPLPLADMWVAPDGQIFAVGRGVAARYDGERWLRAQLPLEKIFTAVWGSSPDQVFGVGKDGVMVRWDGSVWRTVASGTTEDLHALWGRSATEIYAVGNEGTLLRFDGRNWTPVSVPTTANLYGVWGTANSLYVVGDEGTVLVRDDGGWRWMGLEKTVSYGDVWAADDQNVYVTLNQYGSLGARRWNGKEWSIVVEGPVSDIWGRSATEVYAPGGTFFRRFDGTRWETTTVPNPIGAIGGPPAGPIVTMGGGWVRRHDEGGVTELLWEVLGSLHAVWGSSDTDVYAVGAVAGGSSGMVLHYDGVSWKEIDVELPRPAHSVWGSGPDDIHVGTGYSSGIFHFDGSSWSRAEAPGNTGIIDGIWGTGPDRAWAVGSGAAIYSYDGLRWTLQRPSNFELWSLHGIWGSGPEDVYAVGFGGLVLHYDGTEWSVDTPRPPDCSGTCSHGDVWGSSADDVYVVGSVPARNGPYYAGSPAGQIWRREAAGWKSVWTGGIVQSVAGPYLSAIWGRSASEIYAVGAAGTIVHFDGQEWRLMESPTGAYLTDLWGSRTGPVWIVAADGSILRGVR